MSVNTTLWIHQNENGQSTVVDLEGDTEAHVLEATVGYPQFAIAVKNAETGKILFLADEYPA